MLGIIVWGLIGALLGSCVIGLGVIVGWLGGIKLRERIGQWYISLMMATIGNAAIIARKQGGVSMSSVSYDGKFGADQCSIDGNIGHLSDDLDVKSRLANKPFGIGLESHSVYISPLLATIAEHATEAKHSNRLGYQPDGGMRLDFEIPSKPQLPALRDAYRALDGDCRRRWGVTSNDWTKKSQELFHDRIDLGTSLLLIASFGVGAGIAYLAVGHAPDGGGTTVPIQSLLLAAAAGPKLDELIERIKSINWQIVGAISASLAVIVALGLLAGLLNGLWAAVAFIGAFVVFAPLPWFAVIIFKEMLPLNGAISKAFGILGQLTFGRGVLIKTAEGPFEWHALRDDSRGQFAVLNNGDRVPIEGSSGELYRWGMAPLAITEEHGENVERFEVDEPAVKSEWTRETRATKGVSHPKQTKSRSRLVSLSQIQKMVQGSASSDLVRRGRNKAFEEAGGTQQLSGLWTMILSGVMLVTGFILVGVFMLI